MHKHGAHGVCEQKDRRGAVRGQLSILRQLVDTFIQEETKREQEQHVQMVEYLRGVSVFDEVSESILHAIADDLQVEKYSEGQIILKKGDPGTTFFLIKDGTVGFSLQVTNAAEVRLSTLMAVLHVSTPVSHGGAAAAVRWAALSHSGWVGCVRTGRREDAEDSESTGVLWRDFLAQRRQSGDSHSHRQDGLRVLRASGAPSLNISPPSLKCTRVCYPSMPSHSQESRRSYGRGAA